MNTVLRFWQNHHHLFIVSLLTGLLVLALQFVMTALTQPNGLTPAQLQLESVSVSVISATQQNDSMQTVTTLSPRDLDKFLAAGWVADTLSDGASAQTFSFETLALRSADTLLEKQPNPIQAHVRVSDILRKRVTVCQDASGTSVACRQYASNRSGDVVGYSVAFLPHTSPDEGVVEVTISDPLPNGRGLLYPKSPLYLHIRPL